MSKKVKTRYVGVYEKDVSRRDGKNGTEKVFIVEFRKDGKRHCEIAGYQSTHNMTAAKASNYRAGRITGKVLPKKTPVESPRIACERTLSEIYSKYRVYKKERLGSNKYHYTHLKPLYDKRPSELTRNDIESLIQDNLSDQTNAHIVKLVRILVNFGVDHDLCKPLSFRIKLPKVNNTKTETLTPEQIATLLKCLDEDYCWVTVGVIKIALFTGMRKGEILNLQWDDVDLERNFITIKNPKGGVDQIIPINELAQDVLKKIVREKSKYVFYGKGGGRREGIDRGIQRLREKGAFPKGFRPLHGLRHVFASLLASSGKVDMYTLQRLLTHKSPQMTQRYAHLHDDALQRGSRALEDIFK